uniref:Uncharacterized protein n=1 Tax=Meloidogyne enterolobii TaxID=390850 RepID=A0A6V7VJ05_MELEN|nr:unnamed protein product [Meloidogyne enterolobii]
MFGLARVAILSERFPEIFGNTIELEKIIIKLYKIYFTPKYVVEFKEVNVYKSEWKTLIVLDYFIYMEWERKRLEEILKEIKGSEDEKLKIEIIQNIKEFWKLIQINFWGGDNMLNDIVIKGYKWTDEDFNIEIENLFLNHNLMYSMNESKFLFLQTAKECTEHIFDKIKNISKKLAKNKILRSKGKTEEKIIDNKEKTIKELKECMEVNLKDKNKQKIMKKNKK